MDHRRGGLVGRIFPTKLLAFVSQELDGSQAWRTDDRLHRCGVGHVDVAGAGWRCGRQRIHSVTMSRYHLWHVG